MPKAEKRPIITLKSSESAYCYYTRKNKRKTPDRIELTKFDPLVRKHVPFKEKK